ncbi:MAG TPA: AtpZ/AtpI family protein [Cyclobacteriaceae bacterium]
MNDTEKSVRRRRQNTVIRYGGLGMQMLLTIGVAGWLGHKLDEYLALEFPAFLLLFVMVALGGTLYKLYRALRQEK